MHAILRRTNARTFWFLLLLAAAAGLHLACGGSGDDDSARRLDAANQRLVLEFEGRTLDLPLERLDIYLTEDESPEAFELHGPGVLMAGDLPDGIRVDYEENWDALLRQSIPIAAEGGSHNETPKSSTITLPDLGACRVLGGSFTVQSVGAERDARTPVQGTCTIRCETRDGERVLRGKFAVQGTTWG
jgi:hypothetical protein